MKSKNIEEKIWGHFEHWVYWKIWTNYKTEEQVLDYILFCIKDKIEINHHVFSVIQESIKWQ